jgi:hypothetical protein
MTPFRVPNEQPTPTGDELVENAAREPAAHDHESTADRQWSPVDESETTEEAPDLEDYLANERRRKLIQLYVVFPAGICLLVVGILAIGLVVYVTKKRHANQTASESRTSIAKEEKSPVPEKPQTAEKQSTDERVFQGILAGATIAFILTLIVILILVIAYIILVYWVMIWVARDARNRGMESALWAIIYMSPQTFPFFVPLGLLIRDPLTAVLLSPVVAILTILLLVLAWSGLIVYVLARRPGVLVPCTHCPNLRLAYVHACPHCGASINSQNLPMA